MMKTRVSSTQIQRNLPSLFKSLNSSPSSYTSVTSSLNLTEKLDDHEQTIKKKSTTNESSSLSLEDGESLFSSVSSLQLARSLMNLQMASFKPTVDYEEASKTLQTMWDNGLKGILDYGLEDATDNMSCDRNLNEFLRTVESTKLLPPSSVSFACVKITAICPISLLKRVSDLLRWEHKHPSCRLQWKCDTLPVLSISSPFYHTLKRPEPLTPEEEQDLQKAHDRLIKLSQKCFDINLPLLVDAEYTSVQPAIDYLTYSTMINFNKDDNPIVYGTIQAYLKDAKDRTIQATDAAKRMGITIGLKLVRGAYLSSETELASSLGYASPIHKSIQDTHSCYNECASYMIDKVSSRSAAVLLATHNLESGQLAVAKAQALGITKGNTMLQFAQLKGMAEGLSFGLRNAGFLVSKYLAYGPVEMVIPFLLRRAEENRGLLSASAVDRQLMREELLRRLKGGNMGN
ncbi:Proline dehydrogenase 1 protein [Thalictrum thalictroides]|uniref:Proline dehydrogenase n=1 Tax=Thalictrum thalictroides TaxID=46969 RepID=A0A7J6V865_THATH|nr:Proline dehydrogenase 1 protein [Thalictrum thalictroides]